MLNKLLVVGLVAGSLTIGGCAGNYEKYAQAVKEQNLTLQLRLEQREREKEYLRHQHQEKILAMATKAMAAAARTPDKNDDVLVPLLFSVLEDKWEIAENVASSNSRIPRMQAIQPPEQFGDIIHKSTGLILGAGGIALGIVQSNNTRDIAEAGLKAAGTNVSGNNNSVAVDNSTNMSGTGGVTATTEQSDHNGKYKVTEEEPVTEEENN